MYLQSFSIDLKGTVFFNTSFVLLLFLKYGVLFLQCFQRKIQFIFFFSPTLSLGTGLVAELSLFLYVVYLRYKHLRKE